MGLNSLRKLRARDKLCPFTKAKLYAKIGGE
nr:MAG TPA: hypothetical protein [Caudoviricetes sp.]